MALRIKFPAIIFLLLFYLTNALSQTDTSKFFTDTLKPVKIALLVPLYIDSAFDGFTYRLPVNTIPKNIINGLDFYDGAMLAADSLQKEGANIELYVYDTKRKDQTINALVTEMDTINFSLIIASFSNMNEQKTVAAFALSKNVPLVSATYPNNAYITANPFFIMLNPTLKTHVESIYKYVTRNFPVANLIFLTRKGTVETKIKDEFTTMDKKTYPLHYKIVELTDNFSAADLLPLMDSARQNLIICGSIDENFGVNLVRTLNSSAISFEISVMGMPTWDGLKGMSAEDCSNVPIIFSTPYNFSRNYQTIISVSQNYKTKYMGRAGDMVFKGFESVYHFTNLLLKHRTDFLQNLSDPSFKIADDFIFYPVKINPTASVPDYIENKKIYFIEQLDGVVKSVATGY